MNNMLTRLWENEWNKGMSDPWNRITYVQAGFFPSFNSFEKDGKFYVVTELPGMDKKDIQISVEKGVLTVNGEKKETKENYRIREIRYGKFKRWIELPNGADENEVEAEFKDGVLTVAIKVGNRKVEPKRIEVK